jgi:acyl carrier protein
MESIAASADTAHQLIEYISKDVIRRGAVVIDEDTPLVSSGLVDSFALIQIFLKLEALTHLKLPSSKVRAKDMDTVRGMLSMADKIGTPR